MFLKIIWTGWQVNRSTGYKAVWDNIGSRFQDYGIELIDFWRTDWDLAVFLGYPKGFLLGRGNGRRRDVVWHTMWETDEIPEFWVDCINGGGMIWTPSRFCKGVLEKGGVSLPIHVSGYGVDGDVFRYRERGDTDLFTFMTMGRIFGGRKNALKVLEAFLRMRDAGELGDDARLIVKMSALPWKHVTFRGKRRDDVWLVTDKIPQDELVSLYQAADVFVYPTMGEGFGLEPLEAMATGAHALVTNWSGPVEYLSAGLGEAIPILGVKRYPVEPFAERGNMADVDLATMRARMLWCYEHRDEVRKLGAEAAERVRRDWTWDKAAEDGARLLLEYAEQIR